MLIVPCAILIAVWFLVAVNDNRWGDSTYGYLSIVFIATMTFFSFLLDFSSMVVTFNSINSEKTLGRWDLLVLATEKDHISRSKHAFTRLRIARVLAFNLSIRIAVLLFPVLMVTVWGYLNPLDFGGTFTSLTNYVQDFPLESFAIVMFCIPAVLFYLYEPVWRVRAITAMGVALSARFQQFSLLVPLAFVTLVGLWILQAIVLWFVSLGFLWLTSTINIVLFGGYPDPLINNSTTVNIIIWTSTWFIAMAYVAVAFLFYGIITSVAYNRIESRIP